MIQPIWSWVSCYANYTTYLPSGGVVASGGTDLLLAGVLRIVERGAKIGVHNWSDGSATGDTIARDAEAHRVYLDYYRELAIDQAFYGVPLVHAPGCARRRDALDD